MLYSLNPAHYWQQFKFDHFHKKRKQKQIIRVVEFQSMFDWNEIVFEIVGTINIAIICWWTKTVGCHMLLISICLLPRIQLALIGSDRTFKPLYCQRKLHFFPSHNKVWKVVLVYMVMQIKFALSFFFFFFFKILFSQHMSSQIYGKYCTLIADLRVLQKRVRTHLQKLTILE